MYPSTGTIDNCNAGYSGGRYYLYDTNTGKTTTLTSAQVRNVGTYSGCSISGNPAIL